MWLDTLPWAVVGVLSLLLAVTFSVYRRRIARLTRQQEELRTEETRVFDFLHGLGEAFSSDVRPSDLHRLIVEGTMRILDATGGALYLLDRNGRMLMPAYLSKDCPPLVRVPDSIMDQARNAPVALHSYLRLHAVDPEEEFLGRALRSGEPLRIDPDSLDDVRELWPPGQTPSACLAGALVYSRQPLGVLAVTGQTPFPAADGALFRSIAEQSAFALYNAIVFSDAHEKRRLEHDLEVARDIQRILLPSAAPQMAGWRISGLNLPASQVSGDYYDYVRVDDDRMGIVIADVSGKGVPASLIMAMCRSVLRSKAPGRTSAAAVLREVNRQIFPDIKEDMFISMAYLIIDRRSDEVLLARAGHDPPLWYVRNTGAVTKLNPPGMALGIDNGSVFDRVVNDFTFSPADGDCLLLYTDGVTEARDASGLEFGLDKVLTIMKSNAAKGSEAVVQTVAADLREFAEHQPQHDDVTMIALKRTAGSGIQ